MKKTIRLFTTLMLCTAMALCVSCKKDDDNNEPGGGKFSVADGTTVEFAPGNLYWDGSAFKFEDNQWDTNPTSDGTWNPSHVSHFKWSDATNAVTSDENYSGNLFCASNFTVTGDSHTDWRTLSRVEWDYLLGYNPSAYTQTEDYGRPNAMNLCAWVTLTDVDVSGLVILPDGSEVTASGLTTAAAVTESGAVFLPAAGFRAHTIMGTIVCNVGSVGYYWSSTRDVVDAFGMGFDSGSVKPYLDRRYYGTAVRLVR